MAQAAERGTHWADIVERGATWGPALLALVYRLLGRTVCLVAMAPAVLYFYATGARQRRASLDYLGRVWRLDARSDRPNHWHALQHFFAFGESLVDRFGAWIGHVDRADIEAIDGADFAALRADPRGAVILSAHVGATEIARAIGSRQQRRRVNIVIHTPHAAQYNGVIERFAPQSKIALVQAAGFDIAAAVELSAAIERGEWVVMMGDRMPPNKEGRVVTANFLGVPTAFPQGPFVLAAAMRCPIYTLFCYRLDGRYRVRVARLSEGEALPRRRRAAALGALVEAYASGLEDLLRMAPCQWFNFYDYWPSDGDAGGMIAKRGND